VALISFNANVSQKELTRKLNLPLCVIPDTGIDIKSIIIHLKTRVTRQETQALEKNASTWQTMLDGLALSLAGMCGIHCLLTPLLLIAFPIIGSSFFMNEDFHKWMLLAVLPTTGLAIFLGCRRHKDFLVILLSISGFILLCVAIYNHDHSHAHAHGKHSGHGWISRESLLTTLGGIIMVSAHVRNFRLCRKAKQTGFKDSGCSCHS
jgi:hypothetical protein